MATPPIDPAIRPGADVIQDGDECVAREWGDAVHDGPGGRDGRGVVHATTTTTTADG